jgi:hypothetical protein
MQENYNRIILRKLNQKARKYKKKAKLKEREKSKNMMRRITLPMMRIIKKQQRINRKKIIMRLMKHQLNQYLRLMMKR